MESKREYDPMERVRDNISRAAQLIAEELDRTGNRGNDWLTCLMTRSFVVGANLEIAEVKGQLTPGDYEIYQNRLEKLKMHIGILRQAEKYQEPTEEQKQQLLKELNIFAEPEDPQA